MAIAAPKSYDTSLGELLEGVGKGTHQLPEFQRSWTWDDGRIRNIIASLTQGYPMGALMRLECGGSEVRLKYRAFEGDARHLPRARLPRPRRPAAPHLAVLLAFRQRPRQHLERAPAEDQPLLLPRHAQVPRPGGRPRGRYRLHIGQARRHRGHRPQDRPRPHEPRARD